MQTDLGYPGSPLLGGCVSLVHLGTSPTASPERPGARVNGRRAQGWGWSGAAGPGLWVGSQVRGCPCASPGKGDPLPG